MTDVCVILVNWNGWRDTIECLESLLQTRTPNISVVVCDNASSDDSLRQLRAWADGTLAWRPFEKSPIKTLAAPKPISYRCLDRESAEKAVVFDSVPLTFIASVENLGFAGGNNLGLRYALKADKFKFFWLLNNDTVVLPQTLSHMVERMQEDPGIGICGSTLLHYYQPDKVQALGGGYYCKWIGLPWHQGRLKRAEQKRNRDRVERWMNYVVGASMLVSRDFLNDVGLMCEDYFLFFEEADWAYRSKGQYRIAYAPDSVVYHKVGSSIGTSSNPAKKSITCDFYSVRNRLFFTKRFFPYALPTVYLALLGTLISNLLLLKWNRVKMILRLFVNFNQIEYRPK